MINIGKDKYLHFGFCLVITLITILSFKLLGDSCFRSILAGALAAVSAGLAKEFADYINPNNKWDWQDIYADIAGTVGGIFIGSLLWI